MSNEVLRVGEMGVSPALTAELAQWQRLFEANFHPEGDGWRDTSARELLPAQADPRCRTAGRLSSVATATSSWICGGS